MKQLARTCSQSGIHALKYDFGQESRRTQKDLEHVWVGRTSKISISKSPKEFVEGVRLQGRSTSNKHVLRRTLLWPVDSVTFSEAAVRGPCQKQHAELPAIGTTLYATLRFLTAKGRSVFKCPKIQSKHF